MPHLGDKALRHYKWRTSKLGLTSSEQLTNEVKTVPPSFSVVKGSFCWRKSIGKTKKKFTNCIKIEKLKVALNDRNTKPTLNE
jgi:hypothetical protein